MKYVIKMLDFGELHSIDIFAVYENECQPKKWVLLEQFPFIENNKLFKTAVDLACKLRSAGFDVEVTREQSVPERGENII